MVSVQLNHTTISAITPPFEARAVERAVDTPSPPPLAETTAKTEVVARETAPIKGDLPKQVGITIVSEAAGSSGSSSSSSSSSTASSPTTLVISTSLRDGSRSKKLALKIQEKLQSLSLPSDFIDMTQYKDLPQCDGKKCFTDPHVKKLSAQITKATTIILCFPVYNYSCNGVAKNLIDVCGKAWEKKVIGLVATAGSSRSFTGPLEIANNLMLNSECLIVPKYVFADPNDFPEKTDVVNEKMNERLDALIKTSTGLAKAWQVLHTT